MHYSSDTYCLIKWGYFEYPSHYFLQDGRIISTLVCYLAGILNLPYNAYILGMDIIGILFIFPVLAIFLLILKQEKERKKYIQQNKADKEAQIGFFKEKKQN